MEESDRTRLRVNNRNKHYRGPSVGPYGPIDDCSNVRFRTTVDLLEDGEVPYVKHADLTGQADVIENCLTLHPDNF